MQEVGQYLPREWWTYLVVFLSLFVLFRFKNWFRAVYLAFNLPGPPAVPLIGNLLLVTNDAEIINTGKTAYSYYGAIFRTWVSIFPFIVVADPRHLQTILGNTRVTDKNLFYSFIRTFVGKGLTTSRGNIWRSHRKYIQPYFNLNILEMFIPTFVEGSEILVKELKGNEGIVQITDFINRSVLNNLYQAILGIPLADQEVKHQSPYRRGNLVLMDRLVKPWLLLNFFYKFTSLAEDEHKQSLTLHNFSRKILLERKAKKKLNAPLPWCLLECLMEISETYPDFTEQDVIDEVSTFMLAGQESVASATCFTLYFIAKHEDVQEKIMDELKAVFSESNAINIDSLNRMKYLEQCIKEAIRMVPSIPIISRILREDVQLGKHVLPAGCNIFVIPFITNRIPEYYPDPEKFDPDRFSAKNSEKRNPFAFMSFSAGPHNCIGYKFALLEIKTIISSLLTNYKISVAPGYELQLKFRVTLKAKGGIKLKFEPR